MEAIIGRKERRQLLVARAVIFLTRVSRFPVADPYPSYASKVKLPSEMEIMRSLISTPTGIFDGSLDAVLLIVSIPSRTNQDVVTFTPALSVSPRGKTIS